MTVTRFSQRLSDTPKDLGYTPMSLSYPIGINPSFPLTTGESLNGFLPSTTSIFTSTGRERGVK